MGGQQGTRKTAPTPRPQTPRKQPPPPQTSSTPPPVQQPTPVESFISGMGNIADPFFPQAQAQQDIFSTPKPIAKTARHPGSKNIRGNKNQAKIAKAKIALQLAKQKHQQQANIQQQAKFKHAQELAKVEQMYGKDTANAMTGYFEANPDSVDSFNLLPSQVVEKGKWTDGIAALEVTNPMSETPRPKEDKLKGKRIAGFQGTRKGDLQKRHTPEFQHPMMNPFLPTAHATSEPRPPPKLEPIEPYFNLGPNTISPGKEVDFAGRSDINPPYIPKSWDGVRKLSKRELQWAKGQVALRREPQPVSVRYAQEPVENKVQERGFRQQKAEASRVDFALGIKDTGYADVPADPHEIKRQKKNVQISHAGRKQQKAGADYDNTFFEDIRGIPSTFMMYRGTDHERKGTIREWEKLTSAQQQAEKDWETKSGGTSPVSTNNWTSPWD